MRRLANKTERVRTWLLQEGKCALCGDELEEFEVDHIQQFRNDGETALWNLQALCLDCHRSKTSDEARERWSTSSALRRS